MTVIYNMSIDRADKPWIGDRRLTELGNVDAFLRKGVKRRSISQHHHNGALLPCPFASVPMV